MCGNALRGLEAQIQYHMSLVFQKETDIKIPLNNTASNTTVMMKAMLTSRKNYRLELLA